MAHTPGRVLVLGCGSVSQCTLPLLIEHLDVAPDRITVLDMVDNRSRIESVLGKGVRYEQGEITPESLDPMLSERLGPGDLLIDLAWNIDACTMLQWCHDHGVLYVNTSVELWDPYAGGESIPPLERTLYVRHMAVRRMVARWDRPGPTAVVEHGANPGLVSHWTKRALTGIAEQVLSEGRASGGRRAAIEGALAEQRFNVLSQALGVRTIHVSERDTQVTAIPKRVDEFVNTWSVEGFYEEGIAPAEIGWGTHEKVVPLGAHRHGDGPGTQIALPQPGVKTWVRSWVPHMEIVGMVVRHGESFTIADHLTVWDEDRAVYRPTVHYAYCPADVAITSLLELEMRQFELQQDQRILSDEITGGEDRLGVLLMGHDLTAWWTGSLLSIEETRALMGMGHNATTLQVAASVLGCVRWMLRHPEAGVRVPDDLPWQEVLGVADAYLGTLWSGAVDWDPLRTRRRLFRGYDGRSFDHEDPWQFTNFLV